MPALSCNHAKMGLYHPNFLSWQCLYFQHMLQTVDTRWRHRLSQSSPCAGNVNTFAMWAHPQLGGCVFPRVGSSCALGFRSLFLVLLPPYVHQSLAPSLCLVSDSHLICSPFLTCCWCYANGCTHGGQSSFAQSQAFCTVRVHIVASELKDPICHSNECQIGSFSSEAAIWKVVEFRLRLTFSIQKKSWNFKTDVSQIMTFHVLCSNLFCLLLITSSETSSIVAAGYCLVCSCSQGRMKVKINGKIFFTQNCRGLFLIPCFMFMVGPWKLEYLTLKTLEKPWIPSTFVSMNHVTCITSYIEPLVQITCDVVHRHKSTA